MFHTTPLGCLVVPLCYFDYLHGLTLFPEQISKTTECITAILRIDETCQTSLDVTLA